MEPPVQTLLPRIKGDRRRQFARAITADATFDYHGLERGGHNAVLRWLVELFPRPHMFVVAAHTNEPSCAWYHPSRWWAHEHPDPNVVALTYGQEPDLASYTSRIDRRRAVVVARDIRNCLASRIRWVERYKRVPFEIDNRFIYTWTTYAHQVLGDIDHFDGRCVGIVYDRWFADRTYREEVIRTLGTRFGWDLPMTPDAGMSAVARAGGGSSFDKLSFDGKAQRMRVLERWKDYTSHLTYTKLLTPEVLALNDRLVHMEEPP
jgi:hypothetical protein